jgi:hypothetical protein
VRQVTVSAPEGKGSEVAKIAFSVGIRDVSLNSIRSLKSDGGEQRKDHLEVETATHLAKAFVEKLAASSFFNTEEYSITLRQPRSIYSTREVRSLTRPLVEPSSDLFQELWQFSQITFGFIGRIYLGAVLLAFGLVDYRLLFMIAGLLFIPLLPLMLGIGFSLLTQQWKLLGQSVLALVTATLLMAAGGITVAVFSQPPVRYTEANSLVTGLIISLVVGVAAGLATTDDVGRREMIGLAATAQVAIVPTWFGLTLLLGLPANDSVSVKQRALSLLVNIGGIIIASFATYTALRMRGGSLRPFQQNQTDDAVRPSRPNRAPRAEAAAALRRSH